MTTQHDFDACGFFLMRSPLLPITELLGWYDANVASPPLGRVGTLAIRASSQSLASAMKRDEANSAHARLAAERYYVRMSSRSAPFGLLAGISFGRIGSRTQLEFINRDCYTVCAQLDGDVLAHLWRHVRGMAVAEGRPLVRNETILRIGKWYRLVAEDVTGKDRTHVTLTISADDVLEAVVEFTAVRRNLSDIAALIMDHAGVNGAEAKDYVSSLVDRGILCPADLPSPEYAFGEAVSAGNVLFADDQVRIRVEEYCKSIGSLRGDLAALSEQAIDDAEAAAGRLLQREGSATAANIVLVKPGTFEIGRSVIDDIQTAIEFLRRTARMRGQPNAALRRFRDRFVARYEGACVPLLEAVDPDIGIPFDEPAAETGNDVLNLFRGEDEGSDRVLQPGDERLIRLVRALAAGALELTLTPADAAALDTGKVAPLPESFNLLCTLSEREDGDTDVVIGGVGGPSGVRLMTRFAFSSRDLGISLREVVAAEAEAVTPAILVEVTHTPVQPDHWNVSARPPLRAAEMPVLGIASHSAVRIDPASLFVSVVDERVLLTTTEGREVKPRITSAHNYNHHSTIPLYRFLGALQTQEGNLPLAWSWGPLEFERFLPRVRLGRTILARARWRFTAAEVREATDPAVLAAYLLDVGVPSLVILDGLMISLRSRAAFQFLAAQKRRGKGLTLFECYPSPYSTAAHGPEGRFVFEVDIPFHRKRAAKPSQTLPIHSDGARDFMPGDEWVFVKLYCAARAGDDILALGVRPFTQALLLDGAIDRWFFVRYADPEFHIRLRIRRRSSDFGSVIARLRDVLATSGLDPFVHRLSADTYSRELERYGGPVGIELAEGMFWADSEATLGAIAAGALQTFEDKLAYATLAVGQMLALADIPLDHSCEVLARWTTTMKNRIGTLPANLRQILARSNRRNEQRIRQGNLNKVVAERELSIRAGIVPILAAGREGRLTKPMPDLLGAYCHMAINRIFAQPATAQELLVYDAAARRLASLVARNTYARR